MSDLSAWVGGTIRDARKRKGWGGARLGKKVGVSQASISRMESGEQPIDLDTLLEIWWALIEAPPKCPTCKRLYSKRHSKGGIEGGG
jgi:predicted transcriptional regulator